MIFGTSRTARGIAVGASLMITSPVGAANLIATASNLAATLNKIASGDSLSLVGNFGEVRLTNRSFDRTIEINATQATFATTMVFDNVRGVALNGGTFNIGGNGAYAKGVAVYGGSNVYINGVTVNGSGDGAIHQFGVAFSGTHNAQVTASKFSGLFTAIAYKSIVGGYLARNSVTAATSDGIDIADSHRVTASQNTCTGSAPSIGAHPDCIQMWSVAGKPLESDIVVTYNTSYGATQGFTDFDAGLRMTISHNTVTSSFPAGVACYSCVDSDISYNTISTIPGALYQSHVGIIGGSNNTVIGNVVAPYSGPSAPLNISLSFASEGPGFDTGDLDLPGGGSPASEMHGSWDQLAPSGAEVANDVSAVPEPSSWMLLILGFAAAGIARRRRSGWLDNITSA